MCIGSVLSSREKKKNLLIVKTFDNSLNRHMGWARFYVSRHLFRAP